MKPTDKVMTPYGFGVVEDVEDAAFVPAGAKPKILVRFVHNIYGLNHPRTPSDVTEWLDQEQLELIAEGEGHG